MEKRNDNVRKGREEGTSKGRKDTTTLKEEREKIASPRKAGGDKRIIGKGSEQSMERIALRRFFIVGRDGNPSTLVTTALDNLEGEVLIRILTRLRWFSYVSVRAVEGKGRKEGRKEGRKGLQGITRGKRRKGKGTMMLFVLGLYTYVHLLCLFLLIIFIDY